MTQFKFNPISTPRSADETGTGPSDRKQVDYDALNAHVVHAAGTANKARSIPGIIAGIVDLGTQEREPFEGPWNEKDAQRPGAEEFIDDKGNRSIRIPLKPVQQVAILVDFPQILVNKGQFFGEGPGEELPLRMLLNGEFGFRDSSGKWVSTVQRGYTAKDTKHDNGHWGLAKNNTLHKLADAAGLLDNNGLFEAKRIGELLGKAAQFQIRVFMKSGAGGKQYLTETIKFAGMVPEGVPVPTLDERHLIGISFFGDNDPEQVKKLRRSIRNSIKLASDYDKSDIKEIIDEIEAEYSGGSGSVSKPSAGASATPAKGKAKEAAVKASEPSDDEVPGWEDDELLPF